jgi:uncharacterized protein (DUF849 family)
MYPSGPPVILEVAINGLTTVARNPHVPRTAQAVARTAAACIALGASIVHTHNDTMDLPRDDAVRAYAASWAPVLATRPGALLYPTQALGPTMAERLAHFEPLVEAVGLRIGIVDPGCVNVTWADEQGLPAPGLGPYVNSVEEIHYAFGLCERLGLGPSISIYEPTWLNHTLAFDRAGRLPPGAMIKLYFGGPNGYFSRGEGVSFGLPPTAKAFAAYLEMLEGTRCPWSVSVMGGDVLASPVARLALEAGGHVKVGLEDYAGAGTPTNEQLVTRAVELAHETGRAVATPEEAAAILGLPRGAAPGTTR